jgi:hypothetical protein
LLINSESNLLFIIVPFIHFIIYLKIKLLDIPRALLSAIVHDYFLYRGVPGSADMIPSASEPVTENIF